MTIPRPIHPPPTTLYESDYWRWLTETAELLRSGQLDHMDTTSPREPMIRHDPNSKWIPLG